jgi:hypothetical protein
MVQRYRIYSKTRPMHSNPDRNQVILHYTSLELSTVLICMIGTNTNDELDVDQGNLRSQDRSLNQGPTQGPIQGPERPELQSLDKDASAINESTEPGSIEDPSRAMIRNLTLPPIPNFDIPPSPPGSPPKASTDKFLQFIELKQKGVHFNERLEESSALKNLALLEKLRRFAGIDDNAQYASSLPAEVKDATSFPPWAYKDELLKLQKERNKKKQEEQSSTPRTTIDFVPASR